VGGWANFNDRKTAGSSLLLVVIFIEIKEMENLSRGPTFGGTEYRLPSPSSVKCNVLSVDSQNILVKH
jgi:hypothetical protein